MPLIRYQVGDTGTREEARLCECGRGYDLMGSIQGRDTDIVVTPSGNRLIVHFFTGVLEHHSEIDSSRWYRRARVDRLTSGSCNRISKDVAARVVSDLQAKGASDIAINVEVVSEIPLPPSRKRRFVVSNVAKPFV